MPDERTCECLSLFSGIGGFDLGFEFAGCETVAQVEADGYCQAVLAHHWPEVPRYGDICEFDGRAYRGVDIITGGFPCQDISAAGKGVGIEGSRSGMWKHMARIVGEVRPRFAFVENSPMLTIRGLGTVLGDLAEMGYHARWGVLGAVDAGAPHKRERIWIVAYSDEVAGGQIGKDSGKGQGWNISKYARPCACDSRERNWMPEPDVGRVADGVAHRVDRIKALGNGQVPRVAATAFPLLSIDND